MGALQCRRPGRGVPLSLLLLLAYAGITPAIASPPDVIVEFHIPPSDLSTALLRLSREAHLQLTSATNEVDGLRTNGLTGRFTVAEALKRLLAATDLEYRVSSGVISVGHFNKASAAPDPPPEDPPVPQLAAAAPTPAPGDAAPQILKEVVVTGTNIVRNGYQSPTPLTVFNAGDIQDKAPTNISDYIDKMPGFANSESPRTSSASVSDGNGGVSNVDLRSLGAERTLVLLDGMRVVPSSITGFYDQGGSVDINSFPDQLISRIDVVTGGASATYGSDAISGVVNFILNKTFTGVKAVAEGGITNYGDDGQNLFGITAGKAFAGNRGHVLISGATSHVNGVMHGASRPFFDQGWDQIPNPNYTSTNGQPFYLVTRHVGSGLFTPGGLIESGPLRGIDFGPGGSTHMFNYGALSPGGVDMVGGDWQETLGAITDVSEAQAYTSSLDDRISRQNLFGRASYNITDNFEIFTDLLYSQTSVFSYCCSSSETVTINSGNPFIPAPVQAQMTALGIPSFKLGLWNAEQGPSGASNYRQLWFYSLGADGDFPALGTSWSWSAYANRSVSQSDLDAINNPIKANFVNAVDVVANPVTAAPMCASTLADPTNGCVPYNPMGIGMNTPEAMAYATGGVGYLKQTLQQNDFGAKVSGNPISDWAGPVSLAVGVEHRTLGVSGTSSALDQANAFFIGDYHPTIGSYSVTEGFIESLVPLAKTYSWAKELDLDLAARETGYSTSGKVTTWRLGVTYDTPLEGLRFRASRSRDIRAPNLGELYSGGRGGQANILDAVHGNVTVPNILDITIGNPALKPEQADTTGAGVIYRPSWLPGFGMSVDYFNVKINGVISSINDQDEVNECALGVQTYCSFIQRDASGTIQIVYVKPANSAFLKTSGLDLQASYQKRLSDIVDRWKGVVSLRLLATDTWQLTSTDPTGLVTPEAGVNSGFPGVPRWQYNLTLGYAGDAFSVAWTGRGISSGVQSRLYIQCTSSCPPSIAPYYTTSNNQMPGAFYMDLSFTYHVNTAGSPDLFLAIENVADNEPSNFLLPTDSALYDTLGRVYRAGIRFRF